MLEKESTYSYTSLVITDKTTFWHTAIYTNPKSRHTHKVSEKILSQFSCSTKALCEDTRTYKIHLNRNINRNAHTQHYPEVTKIIKENYNSKVTETAAVVATAAGAASVALAVADAASYMRAKASL